MKNFDLIIKNGTAVFPFHGAARCDIGVRSGKIAAICDAIDNRQAEQVLDASGKYVFPGAVDSHYHIGIYRTHSSDAESESRAALVGGVTSLISYFRTGHHYLNKTGSYRDIFPEVLDLSKGHFFTDYSYHIAPMTASQLDEVQWLVEEAGVASFKFYMFYKGLTLSADSTKGADYTMAENYDLGHLYELMTRVSQMAARHQDKARISLSLHCENPELIRVFIERVKKEGLTGLKAYSEARPPLTEKLSVHEAAILADATGCPINLLHLSSREALQAGIDARRNFPSHDIKLETTLHHLALDHEELDKSGIGLRGKVNPPIRTREHAEFLWQGIKAGAVDTVVSDHACCGEEQKRQGVWESLPGFGGSSILYPILISEGAHKRNIPLARIAELAAANPAKNFGLYPRKGCITVGADADFAVVDMNREKPIRAAELLSAQDHTPFEGFLAKGWATETVLRGNLMYADGKITNAPVGEFIKRPTVLYQTND
jgi:dihydroorotase-like cyclic amidohydrolase